MKRLIDLIHNRQIEFFFGAFLLVALCTLGGC